MVSAISVDAPCAVCGTQVPALPWIVSTRPHLVKCDEHRPTTMVLPDDATPPTAGEVFRRMIPADNRDATVEGIHDERLRAALIEYARNPIAPPGGRAYVVLGPAGTGKTGALWAALAAAVDQGGVRPSEVLSGTEQSLVEPMGVQSKFTGRAASWAERLGRNKVVFVDDVGYAQFHDATSRMVVWKDLLDRVCAGSLTLLVSSNLETPKALLDMLGPASASRLHRLARPGVGGMFRAGGVDRRRAG